MTGTKRTASVALAVLLITLAWVAPAQGEVEFQALGTISVGESETEEVPTAATLDATQVSAEPILVSVGGLPIKCESATATAPLETGASPTITLSPSYSNCKVVLFGNPAEILPGKCGLTIHSMEEVETNVSTGKADITCPEKGEILVIIRSSTTKKTTCIIHVYPQTNLKSMRTINMPEATPGNFTLKSEIETMQAVVTKGEEACMITPGTYTNAKITGNTTVTATEKGETVPPPPIRDKVDNRRKFHFAFPLEDVEAFAFEEGVQEFSFGAGNVQCNAAHWEVVLESKLKLATSIEKFSPYEECEEEALMTMNGCGWALKSGYIEVSGPVGALSITCPKEKVTEIEFETKECTVRLGPQSGPLGQGVRGVNLSNIAGPPREVKAKWNIRNLEYEEVGKECKTPGKKLKGGILTGNMRFVGTDTEFHEQVNFELVGTG